MKIYTITFVSNDLDDLSQEINKFLEQKYVEYIDLKYGVDFKCFNFHSMYSAILIYRYEC